MRGHGLAQLDNPAGEFGSGRVPVGRVSRHEASELFVHRRRERSLLVPACREEQFGRGAVVSGAGPTGFGVVVGECRGHLARHAGQHAELIGRRHLLPDPQRDSCRHQGLQRLLKPF